MDQQGEFACHSRAFKVGDHFLYSHFLNVWFRGDTVKRNLILVTFMNLRVKVSFWFQVLRSYNTLSNTLKEALLITESNTTSILQYWLSGVFVLGHYCQRSLERVIKPIRVRDWHCMARGSFFFINAISVFNFNDPLTSKSD